MKRLVESKDERGLEAKMGESIQLWCLNYIYAGTLTGVNDDYVELDPAVVVYETGELSGSSFKDAQRVDGPLRVMLRCVESWSNGR